MANETQIIVNKRSIRFIDTTTKQEYFSTFIDHLRWKRDKNDNFTFFNSVPIANNGGNENNNRLGVLIDITGEQVGVSSFVYTDTFNPDTGTHFVSADIMETWLGDNTGFYFDPNPIGVVVDMTGVLTSVSHDATLTGDGTVGNPLGVIGAVNSVTGLNTDNSDPLNPIIEISVDGLTITGAGTVISPLTTVGSGPTLRNISSTDTFGAIEETLNCTSGTFTVNLPTAVSIQGITYTLVNSGTGTITLDANGTETINGTLTLHLLQYQSRVVQSDGANWIII